METCCRSPEYNDYLLENCWRVKKICRGHIFSVNRSGYAARTAHQFKKSPESHIGFRDIRSRNIDYFLENSTCR